MIDRLPADQRGTTRTHWLHSRHSFSFGQYRNPKRMGFGPLRVINDDIVEPGAGFGEHGHRDMEIISYVVEGALAHRDSLGSGGVIRPGEVQVMSAGTGIRHSEFNASDDDQVRFLQIWLPPKSRGLAPRYDQRKFPIADKSGQLHLLVAPDSADGTTGADQALTIHQDARLYAGRFDGDQKAQLELARGRRAWVQVVGGAITVNDQRLSQGDGAAIVDESNLHFHDAVGAEILVFDLA